MHKTPNCRITVHLRNKKITLLQVGNLLADIRIQISCFRQRIIIFLNMEEPSELVNRTVYKPGTG